MSGVATIHAKTKIESGVLMREKVAFLKELAMLVMDD